MPPRLPAHRRGSIRASPPTQNGVKRPDDPQRPPCRRNIFQYSDLCQNEKRASPGWEARCTLSFPVPFPPAYAILPEPGKASPQLLCISEVGARASRLCNFRSKNNVWPPFCCLPLSMFPVGWANPVSPTDRLGSWLMVSQAVCPLVPHGTGKRRIRFPRHGTGRPVLRRRQRPRPGRKPPPRRLQLEGLEDRSVTGGGILET